MDCLAALPRNNTLQLAVACIPLVIHIIMITLSSCEFIEIINKTGSLCRGVGRLWSYFKPASFPHAAPKQQTGACCHVVARRFPLSSLLHQFKCSISMTTHSDVALRRCNTLKHFAKNTKQGLTSIEINEQLFRRVAISFSRWEAFD